MQSEGSGDAACAGSHRKAEVKVTRPRRRLPSRLRNRCFISISRGGRWWPARVPGRRVVRVPMLNIHIQEIMKWGQLVQMKS